MMGAIEEFLGEVIEKSLLTNLRNLLTNLRSLLTHLSILIK